MDSKAIAQQLSAFRKNRSTGSEYYSRASKGLGISDDRTQRLQDTLRGTEQSYMNVDPSVTGRSQGSLVSEAQRRGMVSNEQAPVADMYRSQSDALSSEIGTQQKLKSEATSRSGMMFGRDESVQSSLRAEYKKRLGSENEAAKRRAYRQKQGKLLSQMRRSLQQKSQLADLERSSNERVATYNRLAKYGY